jgi:hypothetical protein
MALQSRSPGVGWCFSFGAVSSPPQATDQIAINPNADKRTKRDIG